MYSGKSAGWLFLALERSLQVTLQEKKKYADSISIQAVHLRFCKNSPQHLIPTTLFAMGLETKKSRIVFLQLGFLADAMGGPLYQTFLNLS